MTEGSDARDRRFAGAAALAAAGFHLPSLWASFQFDDFNVIVADPAARSWVAWAAGLKTGARPLLKASYALCWSLGGGPAAFHAFNVAAHALNAALIYLIGRRLCARWLDERRAAEAALAAALLFSLHPAQTEAVTYACGRSQSLMACFYLGAVLACLRGASGLALAGLLCAAAAVKETALTLPAALLLAAAFARARPDWKEAARRQAPAWAAAAAALAIMLATARYRQILGYGFTQRGFFSNALTQLNGLWYLTARLATLRGYNVDPGLPVLSAWTPALAAKAAALAAAFALALSARRRRPELAFGALWFALQLAPTNSFVPRLDPANDRQLYLACWGPLLALAVTGARALSPRAARVTACAVLGAFAAASVSRQLDYRSEIRLWESSVSLAPDNARGRNNLGLAYQEAGRLDEARAQYREALRLSPGDLKAAVNLRLLDWSR